MPDAKQRTVNFHCWPLPGQDGIAVDRATYVELTGDEPRGDEQIAKGRYRLGVCDLAALLRGVRRVRIKLIVQPA